MGAMLHRRPEDVLGAVAAPGEKVVLLGLDEVEDTDWAVLRAARLELVRAADVDRALAALLDQPARVAIADARTGPALIRAARATPELATAHVVLCARLGSDQELRDALDAGADDVMRIPFAPEVLAARVAAGLRAARLRANEARLASLVDNIPGAVYRCACDGDWTMEWISAEIEQIVGYPPSDFIDNAVRTFASVTHPDDVQGVEDAVYAAADAGRPYGLEYRLVRPDGSVRWVLERGQVLEAHDGRRWLDGAIFDITARREAEEALRDHAVMQAQLAEVQASRARIIEAADRARRAIERDLHDGAQQRLVSVALQLQLWLAAHRDVPEDARSELRAVLDELRAGLADLRDLARGLHPVLLTERGLEDALCALGARAPVPVDLQLELDEERLPAPIEATAYFVVSEALTNIARHAQATRAWVMLAPRDGGLDVEIGDDGVGGAANGVRSGSGLQGLRDRVASVDGALEVYSPAGNGTILRARLPL
jgi:PAS domain S-box-containing protein